MRSARLLLALCTLVFVSGCDGSMFDDVPWWHWVLLLLGVVVAFAVQIALIVVYVRAVIWVIGRLREYRAGVEAPPPAAYLVSGAIGAAMGAIAAMLLISPGMFLRMPMAGAWQPVLCAAIAGAGVAVLQLQPHRAGRRSRATSELAAYVQQCREAGQDDESIAQALRASGWDEGLIEEALGRDG